MLENCVKNSPGLIESKTHTYTWIWTWTWTYMDTIYKYVYTTSLKLALVYNLWIKSVSPAQCDCCSFSFIIVSQSFYICPFKPARVTYEIQLLKTSNINPLIFLLPLHCSQLTSTWTNLYKTDAVTANIRR